MNQVRKWGSLSWVFLGQGGNCLGHQERGARGSRRNAAEAQSLAWGCQVAGIGYQGALGKLEGEQSWRPGSLVRAGGGVPGGRGGAP